MKILILADINSSHTKKWVEGICLAGIEVGVFSLRECSEDWVEKYPNLTVFPFKKTTSFLGKLGYITQISTVKKIVSSFQPTIVHAHYATSYGMLGVASKAKKLYISVWGSDVFEFPQKSVFHKKLLEFILTKADKLFSTSKIMAVETQKYTTQPIEIIPFGVDTQQFSPQAKTENNHLVIGTVKTLEHIYGIDRLIEATIRLRAKYPQIECHIYGSGSLKTTFEEMIAKNNASQFVFLKGAIPHADVPSVMNKLDVFCNLSRQESFGVAVLEALSCQTPVVVTKVGGLIEVVDDKKSGFLCQENIDDICQKLELLIQDATLRQTMGKNGREWVLQHYNWQVNLKKMLTFYI